MYGYSLYVSNITDSGYASPVRDSSWNLLSFSFSLPFICLNVAYLLTFQFVFPAYNTMLGHLRSNALENFKVRLEQSLSNGEGFASSVRTCTERCVLEFDRGCAGSVCAIEIMRFCCL